MVYVYEVPEKLTNGFCGKGPNLVPFPNVDFFYESEPPADRVMLAAFIRSKRYVNRLARYLVLSTIPGMSFILEPNGGRPTRAAGNTNIDPEPPQAAA